MTIFGIDVHPIFQAGLDIEQVAKEGFSWVAVKASQGTSTRWAAGANAWVERAENAGMVGFCYHYLEAGNVDAQAQAAKTAAAGRPIMVDVEKGSGTVQDDLRPFLGACAAIGQPVCLIYLPQWYWSQVGSPWLGGLPPLVASHYGSATGYASSIYTSVPSSWWASYGGGTVAVLQFTDKASVAGLKVDANAYRGTIDEFRAQLFGSNIPAPAPIVELPTLHEGDVSELVYLLAVFMNRTFSSYSHIDTGPGPTCRLGPQTRAALEEFQRRVGISTAAPFACGPKTWNQLQRFGFRP